MPTCTPDEISGAVEDHDLATRPLRDRMDRDYELWLLEEYDAGDDFKSFTSNAPRTYARKVQSILTSSRLNIRVPHDESFRDQRERNDNKERFAFGILKANDARLMRKGEQKFHDQMSWWIPMRGWYAGRAVLNKRKDGTTYADITPWDPRHVYWGMGGDGLDWICYKVRRTRSELESQYRVDLSGHGMDAGETIEIFDYYDEEINAVCTRNMMLKKPSKHGLSRVPAFVGAVGPTPMVQSYTTDDRMWSTSNGFADYGESIFQDNREIFKHTNEIMSIYLELVSRTRQGGYTLTSRDGSKTLDENPFVEGSEVPLAEGDRLELLPLPEMTKDAAGLLSLVTGESQRGGLPHILYGETPFSLSGYAMNTLRQSIFGILQPLLVAFQNCYEQTLDILVDHYLTNQYEVMDLAGYDSKSYFSQIITPESMVGLPPFDIEVIPDVPQDEMAKVQMAQMMRDGQVPLMSDRDIHEKILEVRDTGALQDRINEQLAERMLPMAQIYNLMVSLENTGRTNEASMYYGELLSMLQEKMQGGQPAFSPLPPNPNAHTNGQSAPPIDPRLFPPGGLGNTPPTPFPQAGPNVPPGSPRPGGQGTPEERLANIGLFGPGGS